MLRMLLLVGLVALASCQGLPVQFGLLPLGDLTTNDQAGPYLIPAAQAAEVEAALAAKTGSPTGPYTDADVLNFLANTECLEATFNTYAAFGQGLPSTLLPGNVTGVRRAQLSNEVQPWAEEVALDEQGHVRMIRQVLGSRSVPCPELDISGGFQMFFDAALNKTGSPPFDPFANDINYLLATWSLEEIGATGDKGCILLASNPGVANAISGLACAASYQSGIDRHHLWARRNYTVESYNMSVADVVAAISNLRDDLDGPPEDDQGLYNSNPNFIAVPTGNINLVPTDLRGLTFSRTPQQVMRILTLGSVDGRGAFFPEGFNGRINNTLGYNVTANGRGGYPGNNVQVVSLAAAGKSGLLNNGTIPLPVPAAPQTDQLEASGEEYGAAFKQDPGQSPSAIYPAGQGGSGSSSAASTNTTSSNATTTNTPAASPNPSPNTTTLGSSPSPAPAAVTVSSPSPVALETRTEATNATAANDTALQLPASEPVAAGAAGAPMPASAGRRLMFV